ncbi:MAG TPA: molybdopterin cofactor-binding domain-containing protein, partial [Gemmatimonadales bacterium]|nr:molybdopterin cofactor-binding domain-containing protein [Gemmatimonadales bacterium]
FQVKIDRYVVVHDCGPQINPMLVEGQIQGGAAHGIGNAFYEQLVFDDNGQLMNASLMDYLMPTALDVPTVEVAHLETPSPYNPSGVKGVGEAGAIPTGAVFAQAVEDALQGTGLEILEIPLSPGRLFELVQEARSTRIATPTPVAGPGRVLAIEGSFEFDGPPEAVYELLLDADVLRGVMPGARAFTLVEDGRYAGTMEVGLGPISAASFDLGVTVSNASPARGYTMNIDARGALGFVAGTARVQLAGVASGTEMRYRAELRVGGTIAAVGQRLLDSVSRVMTKQGLKELNRALRERLGAAR